MTNEQQHYDRKKLIILRAVLILIGGAVGGTALWQYFEYYPDVVRREFQIVITVVSSAVVALILGLSAKPFYRLGASVGDGVYSVMLRLGAKGVAAGILGLIAAGAFVFVLDVIIRHYVDIWAVRLLSDVLAYIVVAVACCYGFTKWLSTADRVSVKTPPPDVGYLLSYECFSDERVLTAVSALNNVKVCDGAYKALCLFDGGADAVKRLDALARAGEVRFVKTGKDFSTAAECVREEKRVAQSKRLKYVSLDGNDDGSSVGLNVFSAPSPELASRFSADEQNAVPDGANECAKNADMVADGEL